MKINKDKHTFCALKICLTMVQVPCRWRSKVQISQLLKEKQNLELLWYRLNAWTRLLTLNNDIDPLKHAERFKLFLWLKWLRHKLVCIVYYIASEKQMRINFKFISIVVYHFDAPNNKQNKNELVLSTDSNGTILIFHQKLMHFC